MERIVATPNTLGEKPIIRRAHISVESILDLLASDAPEQENLDNCPRLTMENIWACLRGVGTLL